MAEKPAEGISVWLYRVIRDDQRLNDPSVRLSATELQLPPLPGGHDAPHALLPALGGQARDLDTEAKRPHHRVLLAGPGASMAQAALVPLPRVHLVRYDGCLAPHSHLRGAIIPTPRQQGMEDEEPDTASPR